MLIADRTFASFRSVANAWFCGFVGCIFGLLSRWNYDSAEAFLKCQNFKIVAFDSVDTIIEFVSSLHTVSDRKAFLQ